MAQLVAAGGVAGLGLGLGEDCPGCRAGIASAAWSGVIFDHPYNAEYALLVHLMARVASSAQISLQHALFGSTRVVSGVQFGVSSTAAWLVVASEAWATIWPLSLIPVALVI